MYGVVLWSDTSHRKAVFWCEDHGDLAFYNPEGPSAEGFGAGDMVQFDIEQAPKLRRAINPRLIDRQGHPDLPDQLRQEASKQPATARILPFRRGRTSH
ncbi:cold shock domain-containing protein [Sulfitobacter sp. S190]|uniref:cold shock domain-containing protein n=1 Tax=Sulfitobacter sp. S190 TaxID=2867022 RepID=UPI0021A4A0CB|nr:cold shock domain-containing protein [Sulfitobacter sp. S190]UWR20945.1 cold shock domain-containing protein [Sulfitobacter sp. S190]